MFNTKLIGTGIPSRVDSRAKINHVDVVVKAKNKTYLDIVWKHDYRDNAELALKKLVHEHGKNNVKISMNGPLEMSYDEWETFKQEIDKIIELAKNKT